MEGKTESQINELLLRYRNGSEEAGETLVVELRPLVRAMASRFVSTRHDLEDLEQVGNIGLWKAIEKYDFAGGAKLTTYAVKWITGEIQGYLRRGHDLLKKNRGAREHDINEIAKQSGVSCEEAVVYMEFQEILIFPGEENLANMATVDSEAEKTINRAFLQESLQKLTSYERKVIFYRYFKEKTQQDVADLMGITQRQVSRLESRILAKMRGFMHE